jgi:predicted transcriptional regulator
MSRNKKNKLKIGIPPDWEEKLAKIAQGNCTSKTAIIYQAIAMGLKQTKK